jgi:hypothetical protein
VTRVSQLERFGLEPRYTILILVGLDSLAGLPHLPPGRYCTDHVTRVSKLERFKTLNSDWIWIRIQLKCWIRIRIRIQ